MKWNHGTAQADELYHLTQRGSRNLEGRGSGLRRADLPTTNTAKGGSDDADR